MHKDLLENSLILLYKIAPLFFVDGYLKPITLKTELESIFKQKL
jgi:hypothetical protein